MPIYLQTLILAVFLMLQGCSAKSALSSTELQSSITTDALLINAIYAEQVGEYQNALKFYDQAYVRSKNPAIKYRSISILMKKKEFYEALEQLKNLEAINGESEIGDRMMISAYTHLGDLPHAQKKGEDLLDKNRSIQNLNLVASIEFALKNYQNSLKLFKESLKKGDEDALLKIADTNYHFLDNKQKALELLNSKIELQGCELKSCTKLLSYLNPEDDSEKMIEIYKKLYSKYKKQEYATAVAEIMVMNKELRRASEFLKESRVNKKMLLDIYKFQKEYKKAYALANTIYKEEPTPRNLSSLAFIEYEMSEDKNNKNMLKSVIKKLEDIVKKVEDDTIDNFYGYLLIDHDIDIDRGIIYVKRALKENPDSPYYLDSLAWGLYKKGKCKEAKKYIDMAYQELKDDEVREHKELIDRCIKEEK
ncbi:MAG: tetratricopeptide repeat protein [Campylobacterales bacterium]